MYTIAYYLNVDFFRREDVVDLGLDYHQLKECGAVVMKKSVVELRRHVGALWKRMDESQKCAFLLSRAALHVQDVKRIMTHLEKMTNHSSATVKEGLDMALNVALTAVPVELRDELQKGLGRRWVRTSTSRPS